MSEPVLFQKVVFGRMDYLELATLFELQQDRLEIFDILRWCGQTQVFAVQLKRPKGYYSSQGKWPVEKPGRGYLVLNHGNIGYVF